MTQYWVKSAADAQADGPMSGLELKRRATAGEIGQDALISTDGTKWYPAARVKGLFAATPAAEPVAAAATPAAAPASPECTTPASTPPPARRGGLPPAYPTFGAAAVQRPAAAPAPAVAPPPPLPHDANGDIATQPLQPLQPLQPIPAPAAPRAAIPPSLGYATPGVTGQGVVRPRRTGAFLIVAILMFAVGLAHAYAFYVNFTDKPSDVHILMMVGGSLLWLGLSVAALALWTIWLAGVHKDMQILTAGQYDVSPAKAAGFLFIPLFNAFWVVFAPSKLAGAANLQLEAAGQPKIPRGAVTTFQIVSVAAPLLGLYGLTPLMYALSMRAIQRGFNRLAANQYVM